MHNWKNAAAAVAVALPIFAAGSAAMATPSPMAMPTIRGYVDIGAGFGSGSTVYSSSGVTEDTDTWTEGVLHGAGRVGFDLSPNLTGQIDAWYNSWTGSGSDTCCGSYTFSDPNLGLGGHLTWQKGDGTLIGLLASVGDSENFADDGRYANFGIEAASWMGNFRIYGQAGYTPGLSGEAGDSAASDIYAAGVLSYFANPNLAFSVNVGADRFSDKSSYVQNQVSWGARIEYKPMTVPASFYVAYEGWSWSNSEPGDDDGNGISSSVIVGLRVPFGSATVADLTRQVGLQDLNQAFGDAFPH